MTETQKAWLAGLVDGEGCIFIKGVPPAQCGPRQKNWSFALWVKVGMCHEPTIRKIQEITGVGSIPNPPKVNIKKQSVPWSWIANGRESGAVLRLIRPYMVTKAGEADVGLAFDALPLPPRGGKHGSIAQPEELLRKKYELYAQLRRLKSRFHFYEERFPLPEFVYVP